MTATTCPTSREAALAYLLGRIDYERAFAVPYDDRAYKLDRMRDLLARLGHPGANLPIVHVAGTKGKGSTSAMIAAMLTATGRTTGLFTSPHLDRLEERMMVDGRPCTGDELAQLVDRLRPAVEAMDARAAGTATPTLGPTYFELTTAMALMHFADRRVDAAVLEVGMGGRLDSTNVCHPLVSVITSIGLDHTRQLGGTLAAIAREKAGIVKPGVPVVSGVLPDEPRREIEAACLQHGSRLVQLGRDFEFAYRPPANVERSDAKGTIDFRALAPGPPRSYADLAIGLLGRHQAANAAVALAAMLELEQAGWTLPEQSLRAGLAQVRWPARVEVVDGRPLVVIDAAHNVASVEALLETLDESFQARPRTLIFATTQEKDAPGMLRRLLPRFDRVVLTRYRTNPRWIPPEELLTVAGENAPDGAPATICPDPSAAWKEALRVTPDTGLICVTGSFFLAAEMRAILKLAVGPLA